MNQELLNKYAGAGVDTLTSTGQYPYIRILQELSAAVKKTHPDYEVKKIEGAQAGDIVDTNDVVLPKPLIVIPIKATEYYEEKSNDQKDSPTVGLRPLSITLDPNYAIAFPDETLAVQGLDAKGQTVTSYHALIRTIALAVVLPQLDNAVGILRFQGSNLGNGKDIQSMIKKFRYPGLPKLVPPTFARSFQLTTVVETNAKKQTYFAYAIAPNEVLDPEKQGDLMEYCNEQLKSFELPGPRVQIQAPARKALTSTTVVTSAKALPPMKQAQPVADDEIPF